MKFWQKVSLCSVVIFLIGFDLAILLFTARSYSLSKEQTYTAAENERYIIQKSLQARLASIAPLYEEVNAQNLKMYVKPYADYYQDQGIYLSFYENDTLVYSNSPFPLHEQPGLQVQPGEKSSMTQEAEGVPYYVVTGRLEAPYSQLKLSYVKDIRSLTNYKTGLIRYAAWIGLIVPAILSLVLTGMLLKLTAPLRALNRTAQEIAKGHYRERVPITGKDELGELAGSFNHMAEAVEAHLQKLSDLTEERQRFIHSLAHEMRTPITAIMGYGDFLRQANYTPEESVKAIDYIVHQSERLKSLSHKLLELAGFSYARRDWKPVDLAKAVEYAEATLAKQLQDKQARLQKELPITCVQGDQDLIESLLLNLMENAVHALADGGEIEVKTAPRAGGVTLSIKDTGMGMAGNEVKKVTEPFYRVDPSRSRLNGGAGLGLTLCKQICEAHNACMEIDSAPGQGTMVLVHFTTLTQPGNYSETTNV